jgi:hypothetical protein
MIQTTMFLRSNYSLSNQTAVCKLDEKIVGSHDKPLQPAIRRPGVNLNIIQLFYT